MKDIVIFTIFAALIILSIQNESFSQVETEEEREKSVKEAHKVYKRELPQKEVKIEEEEKEEEPEIKKIKSKLKKLLPKEEQLEEITLRPIWKFVDKHSSLDELTGIETMSALLRDITRVYDPLVNKYKVSTIQIEIIKYDDIYELEYYWDEISSNSIGKILDNGYLIGSPNENTDCMFNHSAQGAVTLCITEGYVIQSTIFDKYQEHYSYNKLKIGPKKLELNQEEMTTSIVEIILENIDKKNKIESDYELYKVLESNREIKEREHEEREIEYKKNKENKIKKDKNDSMMEERNKNKLLGIEKDKKYGFQNFSCIKDEFGLVTISGQFNNNEIKKDEVILGIVFLDNEQNVIFKNTVSLLNIDEYETKRFLGNTKIKDPFLTCSINVES